MQLTVLGYNYRTTPVALREQLVFSPTELPDALSRLVRCPGVSEAAIVSTCNRTELYCNANDLHPVLEWLVRLRGHEAAGSGFYEFRNESAVQHISRVASGLDSMVLGETQILKQLKEAERYARASGTLGTLLSRLFRHAFSVSKEVRSHTQIGSTSVSLAVIAVKLATQYFSSLESCRILFVGAGKMIERCAPHFAAHGPKQIVIANRTHCRSAFLAEKVHGKSLSLEAMSLYLSEFDIVVASTSSPVHLIQKEMVEQALQMRHGRPILMIDLAVPRNIDPTVAQLPAIHLYTIDDLTHFAYQDNQSYQVEVKMAEQVIHRRLPEFMQWLASRGVVPTICALKDYAYRVAYYEKTRAKKQLEMGLSPEAVLEQFSQALTNKMLHGPLAALNAAQGQEQIELHRLLQKIYPLQGIDSSI